MAGASRVIRLASAKLGTMKLWAREAVRVASETLAARTARGTTRREAAPPPTVTRPQAQPDKAQSTFRLDVPEVIEVDAGWRKAVPIVVSRGRVTGPIAVRFEGLPAGTSVPPVTIPARGNQSEACVQAEVGASAARATVRVTAWAGAERVEVAIRMTVRANPSLASRVQGHSFLAGGKASEAVAAFSRALEMSSADPVILNNRGLAYAQLGKPEAAIADYTSALRLSPENAMIRCNRGAAYARRGDLVRARLDFDTAIRLDPSHIASYRNRAQLYARSGEVARAAADRARADRLERDLHSARDRRSPATPAVPSSPSANCYRPPTTLDRAGGS